MENRRKLAAGSYTGFQRNNMPPIKGPDIDQHNRVAVEPTARRLRVMFAGEVIADSTDARLMFETGHRPVYYFPVSDVRMDLLVPTDHGST